MASLNGFVSPCFCCHVKAGRHGGLGIQLVPVNAVLAEGKCPSGLDQGAWLGPSSGNSELDTINGTSIFVNL